MSAGWPPEAGRPGPPAGAVHIWRAELDRPGWAGSEGLPAEERRRAGAIRRPGAERAWVASRWALRTALARYLDEEPAAIQLRSGPHGKPTLASPAGLDFNLSHSGSLALVAVATGLEVGVDVERKEPGRDFAALAERGLGPEAAALLRGRRPADRADAFYAAWVRQEALLKCGGGGFGNPVPDRPVTIVELDVDAGYAAALAIASSEAPPVRRFTLAPA